jgi:DNA-binding transcriptional MerR regulator
VGLGLDGFQQGRRSGCWKSRREPAGYRLYDDHTLDRLVFIARAKQLGCNLVEIVDLTVDWNGGQYGPVLG